MDIDRALGRAWRDDAPWDLLTRLCELDDRLGGHPGEARAAELVGDALRNAGVRDVETRPFEMARWTRGRTDLAVSVPDRDRERAFEAVALPYSPAGELDAPLVDVGHGTPAEIEAADLHDCVALASTGTPAGADRRIHRMEKVGQAADAGAAAFVFANHTPGQLPPTGALRFGDAAAIPGAGVSAETGDWLREYAADGASVSLSVAADTDHGTSRNVVGHLGPDTDESILLVAHLDGHDVGEAALDNGCGVAVLLGALRILGHVESSLGTGVVVAAVGSEELGLLGSEALAADLDPGRLRAVVNCDGVGRYRRLRALTHTSDALTDLATGVTDDLGHPLEVSERPHPYSDHWPFLRRGVPAIQLHSERPDDEGHWERGWTHTRADTREKADVRTIREHAMVTALLVRQLARDGRAPPGVDPAAVRERLVETGAKPGMVAAGIWPTDW
ncbi:M28 family metallopeptidase [Halorientalis pallida]|uniref:Carboxypeptidase Q n=1 Tax=Halorientalis pallida TaxID=2479928 RepID=A0A498KS12_9EURY|nr:M28 family metallopeptidase [Halorientalis pallida]RXK47367.1 M28 family peptidase [Halorientalis pallida]